MVRLILHKAVFPRDGTPAARGKAFTVEGLVRGREHSASPPGGVCSPAQSACVYFMFILHIQLT